MVRVCVMILPPVLPLLLYQFPPGPTNYLIDYTFEEPSVTGCGPLHTTVSLYFLQKEQQG